MIEELGFELLSELLDFSSVKVKKENKLKDYLVQYNKNGLLYILASMTMYNKFQNDNYIMDDIIRKNNKKSDIIDYIYNNRELMIDEQLRCSSNEYFELLKKVVKNEGYFECGYDEISVNIMALSELKGFSLMYLQELIKKEKIIIHIPSDILSIIKSKIFSKSLCVYRENFNSVKDLLYSIIEVYGVISLKDIKELYLKQLKNIKEKEFEDLLILSYIALKEVVGILPFKEDDILFYSVEFEDESQIFEFYTSREGNYKIFGKNELNKIKNTTFFQNSKDYFELENYLRCNFEDIDMKLIDIMVISEYIIEAQLNLSKARINLSNILNDQLQFIDFSEKNKIMKLIDNIRKSYPSWKLKGRLPINEK